jgi:hypothetical protein
LTISFIKKMKVTIVSWSLSIFDLSSCDCFLKNGGKGLVVYGWKMRHRNGHSSASQWRVVRPGGYTIQIQRVRGSASSMLGKSGLNAFRSIRSSIVLSD